MSGRKKAATLEGLLERLRVVLMAGRKLYNANIDDEHSRFREQLLRHRGVAEGMFQCAGVVGVARVFWKTKFGGKMDMLFQDMAVAQKADSPVAAGRLVYAHYRMANAASRSLSSTTARCTSARVSTKVISTTS